MNTKPDTAPQTAADQTAAENAEPWYKDGLQFECRTCGRCCSGGSGYVWVTQDEINQLSAKMGLEPLLFEQTFVWTVRGKLRSLKEYPNGDCVLLHDKMRKCRTYGERPVQCRTWPFWKQNLVSPQTWAAVAAVCPGCNKGKLHSAEEIEERRKLF